MSTIIISMIVNNYEIFKYIVIKVTIGLHHTALYY